MFLKKKMVNLVYSMPEYYAVPKNDVYEKSLNDMWK